MDPYVVPCVTAASECVSACPLQMEKSFDMQKGMGMQQEGESDEFKRILLEGNPVLLVRGVGAARPVRIVLAPSRA